MDLPTNIQKVGENNVSYDHNDKTYIRGIDYIENKISFYETKKDQYEEGTSDWQFYENYRAFYQYIKDEYDAIP